MSPIFRYPILLILLSAAIGNLAHAQVKLGDNITNVNSNAVLELESTSKGLLLPRLTTAQINNMASPPKGMIVFNSTDSAIWVRRDTGWAALAINEQGGQWMRKDNDIYSINTGNVGIGTSSPTAKLHTVGTVRHQDLSGPGVRPVFVDSDGNLKVSKTTPIEIVSSPSKRISGRNCTMQDSITVSGLPDNIPSAAISVTLNMLALNNNFNVGVFEIDLTAPNGQILNLTTSSSTYPSANAYVLTVFADSGDSLQTGLGSATYTGTYKPVGDTNNYYSGCYGRATANTFAALGGGTINPNGKWTLNFVSGTDIVATLQSWSVRFNNDTLWKGTTGDNLLAKWNRGNLEKSGITEFNGKLGIGTASPTSGITSTTGIAIDPLGYNDNTLNNGLIIGLQQYGTGINSTRRGASGLDFYTSYANQMKITYDGSVGIGTQEPQQNLSVENGMNIDQANANSGGIGNGLTFGSYSTEGIASKRAAGGNQYGLDFYTNNTNRIAITASGNVGIGTTAPAQKLTISGGNIRLEGYSGGDTISSWTNLTLRANDNNDGLETLNFMVGSAERMRINASGNVGIGTNAPSQKFTIQGGNIRMQGVGTDTISSWASLTLRANDDGNSSESLNFAVGSSERMRIDALGNVGIGTNAPTVKLDVIGDIKYSGNLDMGIVRVLKTQEVAPNSGTTVTCSCPANTKLIGGGGGHTLPNADMDDILMPYNGPKPDSPDTTWIIYIRNYGTTIHYLSIYAICAKVK